MVTYVGPTAMHDQVQVVHLSIDTNTCHPDCRKSRDGPKVLSWATLQGDKVNYWLIHSLPSPAPKMLLAVYCSCLGKCWRLFAGCPTGVGTTHVHLSEGVALAQRLRCVWPGWLKCLGAAVV